MTRIGKFYTYIVVTMVKTPDKTGSCKTAHELGKTNFLNSENVPCQDSPRRSGSVRLHNSDFIWTRACFGSLGYSIGVSRILQWKEFTEVDPGIF